MHEHQAPPSAFWKQTLCAWDKCPRQNSSDSSWVFKIKNFPEPFLTTLYYMVWFIKTPLHLVFQCTQFPHLFTLCWLAFCGSWSVNSRALTHIHVSAVRRFHIDTISALCNKPTESKMYNWTKHNSIHGHQELAMWVSYTGAIQWFSVLRVLT